MMDYSTAPTTQMGAGDLIPDNTLCWAYLSLKPYNLDQGIAETPSKSTVGGAYLSVELTIADGPFAKRKIFDMIGVKGSEGYVNNGRASIRAILEVGRGANVASNPQGYNIRSYFELDPALIAGGQPLKVAVKVGVDKATPGSGYSDKNRVKAYLTPNPESNTNKDWQKLLAGDTGGTTTGAVGHGAHQTAQGGQQTPDWARQGQGGGQQGGAPFTGNGATAGGALAGNATTGASPSDGGPSWLRNNQ